MVVSVPFPLRFLFASQPTVMGKVLGIVYRVIAIRTAVIKDGMLHVQAGAGIVADSNPATEWEETMNKGRALIAAVNSAATGL